MKLKKFGNGESRMCFNGKGKETKFSVIRIVLFLDVLIGFYRLFGIFILLSLVVCSLEFVLDFFRTF